MNVSKLRQNRRLIWQYGVFGISIGILFALLEYLVRINTDDPQLFFPLIIRGILLGALVSISVAIFEIFSQDVLKQKRFLYIVLVRSSGYTLLIVFWLSIINGIWSSINLHLTFFGGLMDYYSDSSFIINVVSVFLALILLVGARQINSLHRKGELLKFILGRYHTPQEVNRIFCFIDLKGSTTIAERLGHLRFGSFLKDYYSDISDAIRNSQAEIYQYVGDEIILSWPYNEGIKDGKVIHCFFRMREQIETLRQKYMQKYGVVPEFKAGLHGGQVTVTWVGELKKEIVYLGDVLNTTARIQENCKRLSRDFLISQELLEDIPPSGSIIASFVEEIVPRGKEQAIRLYSLERVS
jgi:adenylate cyclase